MDKLNPVLQDTPVSTKYAESVGSWYTTEATGGVFSSGQIAWMQAAGWTVYSSVTEGDSTTYFLTRRKINPERVLQSLVTSYTNAYNEGRQLNDQRYDDLLVLYSNALSVTEDEYNDLEADDATFEAAIETLIGLLDSDYVSWAADVDGDLDAWGTDLLAEINARFDALLSTENQKLVDRGLYNSTLAVTAASAVERERQRALNQANDTIEQRQLELKNLIYKARVELRRNVIASRDRLRVFLHGAKDRQVEARDRASLALARLVEARTDSYPDLAEVGRLASGLGAGSPESYAP